MTQHFFILRKSHTNTGLDMGQAEYPTFAKALEASGVERKEWTIDSISFCCVVEHNTPVTYTICDYYRVDEVKATDVW